MKANLEKAIEELREDSPEFAGFLQELGDYNDVNAKSEARLLEDFLNKHVGEMNAAMLVKIRKHNIDLLLDVVYRNDQLLWQLFKAGSQNQDEMIAVFNETELMLSEARRMHRVAVLSTLDQGWKAVLTLDALRVEDPKPTHKLSEESARLSLSFSQEYTLPMLDLEKGHIAAQARYVRDMAEKYGFTKLGSAIAVRIATVLRERETRLVLMQKIRSEHGTPSKSGLSFSSH